MTEQPDLQSRLSSMSVGENAKPRRAIGLPTAGAALAVVGALGAYLLATGLKDTDKTTLQTSNAQEFQSSRGSAGRLEFAEPDTHSAVDDALIRIEDVLSNPSPQVSPPPQDIAANNSALLNELAALREALADSTAGRDKVISEAVAGLKQAFEDRTAELEAASARTESKLAKQKTDAEARITALQSLLDAERAQRESLQAERDRDGRMAIEAEKLAQQERDLVALEQAQIRSPAVIYAAGQSATATSPASQSGTGYTTDTGSVSTSQVAADEAFLRNPPALVVQDAQRMQNPDRTLAQGSVVQAALQVAINSDLPGNVVAVVSEPVPAFSGDSILIPRGSRLFGSYSAGVQAGQKRILIAWSRILTPDGISMQIAAQGGDMLGRSGVTGFVDSKFGERFGGAALISLIGAGPSLAARASNDDVASETMIAIGGDLEDVTGTVIAEQLARKPTIYVDQGQGVTVLVDRDVVIW